MWFSWHNWCVTWFVDLINNFCEMTNWGIKLSIYSNLFNTYCTCYSINIPCSDILVGTIQVKLSSWENTYLWDVLSISTLMAHKDMHNSFFLHAYHVTWSCLYAHTFQEDCYLVIMFCCIENWFLFVYYSCAMSDQVFSITYPPGDIWIPISLITVIAILLWFEICMMLECRRNQQQHQFFSLHKNKRTEITVKKLIAPCHEILSHSTLRYCLDRSLLFDKLGVYLACAS